MMNVEKRVLDYLCKEAKTTLQEATDRFKNIDERLKRIQSGEKFYEDGAYDYFPLEFRKVVDAEKGIIEVYEPGLPGYMCNDILKQVRETNVLSVSFEDEMCMKI